MFLALGGLEASSYEQHELFVRVWANNNTLAPLVATAGTHLCLIGLNWKDLLAILEQAIIGHESTGSVQRRGRIKANRLSRALGGRFTMVMDRPSQTVRRRRVHPVAPLL